MTTNKTDNVINYTCATCGGAWDQQNGVADTCPASLCGSHDIAGTSAEDKLRHYLAPMGVELSFHVVDAGSYKAGSKFACTVKRGHASHMLEYSKGCAHRMWTKHLSADSQLRALDPHAKVGAPVSYRVCGVRQLSIGAEATLKNCTGPIPPTLSEVLAAMSSDAECVRHGQTFDDFCAELGYDSDSRTAEKCYNACRDEWVALIRLGFDLDTLGELCREL